MMEFNDDIFVINCWVDNDSKEKNLIDLINILRTFNIPILLTGSYPLKPELQKLGDYFIFDKENPILLREDFQKYNINSVRWTQIGDVRIENHCEYHHDYAVWSTMKNAFNFCKYLGKEYIHFFDYDNLPDPVQYRQSFLEKIREGDFVIYEYEKNSSSISNINPFCAMFIFSIRTNIAVAAMNLIKNKDEFFRNKDDKWQLEKNLLNSVRQVTSNVIVSPYIANDNELNLQSKWSRNGTHRNGAKLQLYLAVDDSNDLYLHTISGFHESPAEQDYLIEINYNEYKKFHVVAKGMMDILKIGKYKEGSVVYVYYEGVEILSEFLYKDVNDFRKINKLIRTNIKKTNIEQININFVDGPFFEIKSNVDGLYNVQFINKKTNSVEYELDMKNNHWAKSSKKYYIDWIIKIDGIDNDFHSVYEFNPENKLVYIAFESRALGDTIAWMPYVEKFRIQKQCRVVCSTFRNNLFEKQYPNIEFITPGTPVNNLYAMYRIGLFYSDKKIDYYRHPIDPLKGPLSKIATDILGLEYEEIRPQLPILSTNKKKMVSIAIHSTAQCKYWNNPTGWQDVVNFLNDNGYEVKLVSQEDDGYMGNRNPKGITKMTTTKIEDTLRTLQESELFIGISSGLSWLAWAGGTKTVLISGFTDVYNEPVNNIIRIINKNVCNSCWHNYTFDAGNWNWCPLFKNTDRQFECSKAITSEQVIGEIKKALNL